MSRIIVIAKAPAPGRTKTRLCPPCTHEEAAGLARAALLDTLDAVLAADCAERVLCLDGDVPAWLPHGLRVVPQRTGGLGERIAGAFADAGPGLLIGMDTPQVTPALLDAGITALGRAPAVLAPADDGGYWAIGLREPRPEAFAGVPMSTPGTGSAQRARLHALGLRVGLLPALRDVDTIADARAVAQAAPKSRFAAALARLGPGTAA